MAITTKSSISVKARWFGLHQAPLVIGSVDIMSPEVGPKNWAVVKNGVRAKPSKRKEKLEEDANSIWKDQPDSPKGVYLLGFVHSTQKFHKNCKFENNCPPFLNLVSKTSRRISP